MFAILRSRGSSALLALNAALYLFSPGGVASAQENSLAGCWRHESQQDRYKNFLEICLGEGGQAEATSFENGYGRGRNARWETVDGNTLSLVFASDDKVRCKFSRVGSLKLALTECSISDFSNVFARENASGGRSTRQSICWGAQYPDNGDFEIAQVAERTLAIIELEHKQVDEDEPYIDAGAVVVVWGRSGQHACVENLSDSPEANFWINQSALKSLPVADSNKKLWSGTFRRTTSGEISSVPDGGYDVYGQIEHTQGHGPGWGYTMSNEIIANAAKPLANAIEARLRRDVTTAGSKAPTGIASHRPGRHEAHALRAGG
jgi:hypothetical protein